MANYTVEIADLHTLPVEQRSLIGYTNKNIQINHSSVLSNTFKVDIDGTLIGYTGKDVRVDRSSVLGNPYEMKTVRSNGELFYLSRNEVCDQYEIWFHCAIRNQDHPQHERVVMYLNRILDLLVKKGEITLWCWCAPKRCHAETIKRWLEAEVKDYQYGDLDFLPFIDPHGYWE